MATQSDRRVNVEQVNTALCRLLIQKVRTDQYPSFTQMNIIEQSIPPSLHREYVSVLLEKVMGERFPSTSMLRRIQRFAGQV